ncbi:MAG: GIY-YIG nuclease family protein [Candidatus Omnitrophota bacterium]
MKGDHSGSIRFVFAMWYVYICQKNKLLYTGVTTDTHNRSRQHRPANLLYVEQHFDKRKAFQRERQIKGWRREKKQKLIAGKNKQ